MNWNVSLPQVALVGVVACLVVALGWGLATSGVALGPYNPDWDGASEFRTGLADEASVTVATSTGAYEETPPEQTVGVLLEPGEGYDATDSARLSSFLAQGGTLVVAATDNGSNGLLAELGSVQVDGTPVRDEQSNDGDPALVEATEVGDDPLVADVDGLVLNRGTVLEGDTARALVNTTRTAYLDVNRNQELDPEEPVGSWTVAAVEDRGAGQLVVVSDASVFTNAMVEREGNAQFVRNLAEAHEYAILDYSQRAAIPPATYAFLTVRGSTTVQVLVGLVGVGAIALWGQTGVSERLSRREADEPAQIQPDEEALTAYLREEHPTWDEKRVERVTKAIIRQRQQEGDDD